MHLAFVHLKYNSEVTAWIYSRMKQFKALKLRLACIKWKMIFPQPRLATSAITARPGVKVLLSLSRCFSTMVVKKEALAEAK